MHVQHDRIGGTAANIIAHGQLYDSSIVTLWRELTGAAEPKDLSDVLAVQMGINTERFNRFWFHKITGYAVEEAPTVLCSTERDYCVAQCDGFVLDNNGKALFEAKHTGTYDYPSNTAKTIEHVATLYYPQIQHYLYVTELDDAYLSVFFGNSKHAYQAIRRDDQFIGDLLHKIDAFWDCVENKIPPKLNGESMFIPEIEIDRGKVEIIDSSHPLSNEWASAAADFVENKDAAFTFESSKKSLKNLIPPDAYRTEGYGVSVVNSGKRRVVNVL
tara:strand:+ start:786 stop:1604 length:819 start_codon:yes stop_codon:yes gene_type:complete